MEFSNIENGLLTAEGTLYELTIYYDFRLHPHLLVARTTCKNHFQNHSVDAMSFLETLALAPQLAEVVKRNSKQNLIGHYHLLLERLLLLL